MRTEGWGGSILVTADRRAGGEKSRSRRAAGFSRYRSTTKTPDPDFVFLPPFFLRPEHV
jgi:hypothetical protein